LEGRKNAGLGLSSAGKAKQEPPGFKSLGTPGVKAIKKPSKDVGSAAVTGLTIEL
jgi:hypothetical protein